MKRIVFAEGKYDIKLMEHIITEGSRSFEVTDFIGEDVVSSIGGEESRAIRSFIEQRNPYELFLKSEGGKHDLKRLFSQLMPQLYSKDIGYYLLIDLDGGSFGGIANDINRRCESLTVDLTVEIGERTVSNYHLNGYNCKVHLNGEHRDSFHAIGFNHSMEISAGIDKGSDDRREKISKVRQLAEDDLIKQPIKDLFLL